MAAAAIAAFSLLLFVAAHGAAPALGFRRSDFPEDFVFGAATSAYQYEGAVAEDGRSPSIWDTFTHAGKMPDKSNGDVAADGYHKYKDDVKLIAETGLEAYRFSISWSRLIPNGRGAVNPKGLQYYNNLIDELVRHGVQIHVMLYQLDLPQVLEDEYGGWLSPRVVEDFTAYADVCFREFGDRVLYWTTLDEVNIAATASYDTGQFPPGRCSDPFGITKCAAGIATSNGSLHDTKRVDYMKKHIGSTLTALRNEANVKGYFAWSFLDVFELVAGFKSQYGLYRVNFDDEALPRQAKASARWYSNFLKNKGIRMKNEVNMAGSDAEQ
ncbi:hypothetical protein EJB05_18517 [Eragrostis curvula]|uniref:4-hydroxy-7-methoxy-3-oxo-3,4-dihydro-2H-1,4-benzoxazin-2-yl glucosidebeta-D-glucosidase n=1 Tax=Eragrostis curvula TaxID=38414 RepID=A0A5J9VJZ0_9POAL|nr:hypothetical protein EJB05_18517 [Eragrostis curvula]